MHVHSNCSSKRCPSHHCPMCALSHSGRQTATETVMMAKEYRLRNVRTWLPPAGAFSAVGTPKNAASRTSELSRAHAAHIPRCRAAGMPTASVRARRSIGSIGSIGPGLARLRRHALQARIGLQHGPELQINEHRRNSDEPVIQRLYLDAARIRSSAEKRSASLRGGQVRLVIILLTLYIITYMFNIIYYNCLFICKILKSCYIVISI